jgi:hypothetical protein
MTRRHPDFPEDAVTVVFFILGSFAFATIVGVLFWWGATR